MHLKLCFGILTRKPPSKSMIFTWKSPFVSCHHPELVGLVASPMADIRRQGGEFIKALFYTREISRNGFSFKNFSLFPKKIA